MVTLGADPEFFLETKAKGKLVPSQGRVEGTKQEPHVISPAKVLKVAGYSTGVGNYAVQRDNVAVEYNIPYTGSKASWERQIKAGLALAFEEIPYSKRRNLKISHKASAHFPEKYLEHEEAKYFGCEPDYNAWTVSENVMDKTSVDPTLRTVGGHVHIGYLSENPNLNPLALVRMLDVYLGVPSIFLDDDNERRLLYGKAGAYRPVPYGIEYRTLSNFWIFKIQYIRWVWDAVVYALQKAKASEIISPNGPIAEAIQTAINKSDKDAAEYVFDFYPEAKLLIPGTVNTYHTTDTSNTTKIMGEVTYTSFTSPSVTKFDLSA